MDVMDRVWRRMVQAARQRFPRQLGRAAILEQYARKHGRSFTEADPEALTTKVTQRMLDWLVETPRQATLFSDKIQAKEEARRRLGDTAVAELYWCGSDLSALPWELVRVAPAMLKASHASRRFLHLPRIVAVDQVCEVAAGWLRENYAHHAFEMQYADIYPMVLLEEYLEPKQGPLYDYKFWCFHGEPLVVHVDDPLQSINPFYDMDWDLLPVHYRAGAARPVLPKPANWPAMKDAARTLAQGWDFVRIDLYNVDGRIVFGEYTFTPNAGGLSFLPSEWDRWLGRKW